MLMSHLHLQSHECGKEAWERQSVNLAECYPTFPRMLYLIVPYPQSCETLRLQTDATKQFLFL
jgi:hypothetical protein